MGMIVTWAPYMTTLTWSIVGRAWRLLTRVKVDASNGIGAVVASWKESVNVPPAAAHVTRCTSFTCVGLDAVLGEKIQHG